MAACAGYKKGVHVKELRWFALFLIGSGTAFGAIDLPGGWQKPSGGYDGVYDAANGLLPEDSTPAFTGTYDIVNTNGFGEGMTAGNTILSFTNSATAGPYYQMSTGAGAGTATGSMTFDIRLKLADTGTINSSEFALSIYRPANANQVSNGINSVQYFFRFGDNAAYYHPLGHEWVDMRILIDADIQTPTIYLDGSSTPLVLGGSYTFRLYERTAMANYVRFGDLSSSASIGIGSVDLAYFAWSNDQKASVVPPPPAPGFLFMLKSASPILIETLGGADPVDAGFLFSGKGTVSTGSGYDGEDYWYTRSTRSAYYLYTADPSDFQDERGWTATYRTRVLPEIDNATERTDNFFAARNGLRRFDLSISGGSVSNTPGVYALLKTGYARIDSPPIDVTKYHTYQIVYDPDADSATYYADGSNLATYAESDLYTTALAELRWGDQSSATTAPYENRTSRVRLEKGAAVVLGETPPPLPPDEITTPTNIPPPGVVIDSTDYYAGAHIGSPSILILPDGTYLAAHDWFDASPVYTEVFRSTDHGASWSRIASVPFVHFATLFYHAGNVYLMGTSVNKSPGYITIHRSTDGGTTWTAATSDTTGKLIVADRTGRYACAPTPAIKVDGRIWKGYTERLDPNSQGYTDYRIFFMSAATNADLLAASSWTRSNGVEFDSVPDHWINAKFPGWLEPAVVEYPAGSGNVLAICRMDTWLRSSDTLALSGYAAGNPRYGLATAVAATSPTVAAFDETDPDCWLAFPGGQTKFTIRYDSASGLYWSVANIIANQHGGTDWTTSPMHQRNVLALVSSSDLQTWTQHEKTIRWKEGDILSKTGKFGFHYADWQFDGDDIVYVIRNSWDGDTYHDANYFTFHRIPNFRTSSSAGSAPDRGAAAESMFACGSVAAEDGFVVESSETSNAGGFANATSESDRALCAGDTDQNSQVKSILSFDTSALPDDATITAAVLKMKRGALSGTNPFATHGRCYVDIKGGSGFSGSTILQMQDFEAPADVEQVALVSNVSEGDIATAQIDTDGLAFINRTGKTQFRISFAMDDNDDSDWNYVAWYSGNSYNATNRPVLEITYQ